MPRKLKLPPLVHLPATATVTGQTLHLCLARPSRQLLHYYRKFHNFPRGHREGNTRFYFTREVERWLISHGCTVERVK